MTGTALITGISGQDGAYLAQILLAEGWSVAGTTRTPGQAPNRLIQLGIADRVRLLPAPSGGLPEMRALLTQVGPDEIYHLAAETSLTAAAQHPMEAAQTNAMVSLAVFEAVRQALPKARVFLASTAQVYGRAPMAVCAPEGPFAPTNLYGASKLFAQSLAEIYRDSHKLFIACGILFAHESPLRGSEFLSRKVTRTLARIALGQEQRLMVGNMDAERDWSWAPDVVRGMRAALRADMPGTYVFASGQARTVRDLISEAARHLGMPLRWSGSGVEEVGVDERSGNAIVGVDPRFFRPFDERTPPADISATERLLGWRPSVDFSDIVKNMCVADLAEARATTLSH